MKDKVKRKYERPIAVDTGSVAAVLGNKCSSGGVATDGCISGNDPHVAPVCQPGATATYNCGVGTVNTDGNCSNGGNANGGCFTGSTALNKSRLFKNTFSR